MTVKTHTLSLVLVCAFLTGSTTGFAQDESNYGVRLGWQNSNLWKNGNSLFDGAYNSFYLGISWNTDLPKSELLGVGIGLTYYQVGSRYNENNKVRLHFLNLPVSIIVRTGPVYGFVGLNGAVKLGGQSYLLGIKFNVDDFTTFDAGVFLGAGVKISIIGIEAKYDWSLVDIRNGYNTRYLQLGLQVFF